MSIKTVDFIREIEAAAPLSYAEEWDNSGIQIDLGHESVSRVLVALDPVISVAEEAEKLGVDMVLAHHPLFFRPVSNLVSGVDKGGVAIKLIRSDISLYSAHTSFDSAPGGMNDILADMAGLSDISPLPDDGSIAFVRRGAFKAPVRFGDLCARLEEILEMPGALRTVGSPDTMLRTGAVCGGAGGSLLEEITGAGIDLYLTSDIRHDEALYARAHGLCLIDGGHWGTEHHFIRVMAARLREAFGADIEVIESRINLSPWE